MGHGSPFVYIWKRGNTGGSGVSSSVYYRVDARTHGEALPRRQHLLW